MPVNTDNMVQNAPRGRVNVNLAGSFTSFWDACLVLWPKAEKGRDTTNTAQPRTVATIPNGLTRRRSAVIVLPVISVSFACAAARAEVPNGTQISAEINRKIIVCFLNLCIFSSFSLKLCQRKYLFIIKKLSVQCSEFGDDRQPNIYALNSEPLNLGTRTPEPVFEH